MLLFVIETIYFKLLLFQVYKTVVAALFYSRLRVICQHVSNSKTFDFVILFFIGLNCITLAMERPDIPPRSVVRFCLVYDSCANKGIRFNAKTKNTDFVMTFILISTNKRSK